jgi:hypothetical protein
VALKLPLSVKILGARLGGLFGPFFPISAIAQQALTFCDGFSVPIYKSITEITRATATLTWTADPWNGKLDLIRHPSAMQQAIERHPTVSGDCDDFAAYDIVALHKSCLAEEEWLACALWVDPKTQEITGHAVCVFQVEDKWFYIGNWNKCVPIQIDSKTAYIWDLERRTGQRIVTATMWRAWGTKNDSLMLDECIRVVI